MKMILTLTAAAIALCASAQRPTFAQGQGPFPWCELGFMSGGPPGDCSFATFALCMQTARGDGTCQRNPRFDAPYFQRGETPPVDLDPNGRPLRPPRK